MGARTKTNYHEFSLDNTNKYICLGREPKNVKCIFARCINQFLKDISVSQHCGPNNFKVVNKTIINILRLDLENRLNRTL